MGILSALLIFSLYIIAEAGAPTNCVEGNVRLTGESPLRGRLEICRGGIWGTVCAQYSFNRPFGTNESSVVCVMLGHQPFGE